jgi:myo-inositol 2-dehydrogenase / D-chiro-inositol 1-dehydrogenase
MMKIGLIGLGRMGSLHARTLASLPAVDKLLVADSLPGRADEIAATVDAQALDHTGDMWSADIDGLVIAAATDAHPALLEMALEAGLPVFCEKPVAANTQQAARIARRVASRGDRVQIGYPRRFDPGFVAAREAVAAGQLGWLHTARSTTLDPAPPSPEYAAVSGGIFRDCGVHDFDAIRWATGREITEVYATGSNRGDQWIGELGDVDTASAILRLDDGTLGVVSNTRFNGRGYDVRLELHGSLDSIAAGLGDGLPVRSAEPGAAFPAGPPHQSFADRFTLAFQAELAVFTEVVAGERPSPCTVGDAVEASWVAEAATVSLRERRPVPVDELRSER